MVQRNIRFGAELHRDSLADVIVPDQRETPSLPVCADAVETDRGRANVVRQLPQLGISGMELRERMRSGNLFAQPTDMSKYADQWRDVDGLSAEGRGGDWEPSVFICSVH